MKKELFYAGTPTRAARARDILAKNGIRATIERGYDKTEHGCGWSVMVIEDSTELAREILQKSGLL